MAATEYRIAVDGRGAGAFQLSWAMDLDPPDTMVDSGPDAYVASDEAVFGFSSTEADSTFRCSLDAEPAVPCADPQAYQDLAEGGHTFEVYAVDRFGNIDPTPASSSWTVDLSGPHVLFVRPGPGVYALNQELLVTGSDTIVIGDTTVTVRLTDATSGVAWASFAVDGGGVDPAEVTRVGDDWSFTFRPSDVGPHTISAEAANAAGLTSSGEIEVMAVGV